MALNGTSEQIVLDCNFSYDSEDQLLVSTILNLFSLFKGLKLHNLKKII